MPFLSKSLLFEEKKLTSGSNWKPKLGALCVLNYIVSYLKARTFLRVFFKPRAFYGIWRILGAQFKLAEKNK